MIEYLGGKCSRCGYDSAPAALQFHHADPGQKEVNLSDIRAKAWPQIELELLKCVLLCANCHSVVHATDPELRTQAHPGAPRKPESGDGELIVCTVCGRTFRYDRRRGHSKRMCNSCNSNRLRDKRRIEIVEFMGGKCQKCGYAESTMALHCHHRDPNSKTDGVNIAAGSLKSPRIRRELNKCILLCANCHAVVHWSLDRETEV